MIDLIEKIAAGLCGLLVLLTTALYAILPLPDLRPNWVIPDVREVAAPAAAAAPGAPNPPPASPEMQAIADKLAEQGRKVSPSQIQKKTYEVPEPLFEVLSTETNAFHEARKAKSNPITSPAGDTRLQIFDIHSDSYLKKLGFQDNDVIELIDGEILDFKKTSSSDYWSRYNAAIDKLRTGEPITVTLTRGGRSMHLEFKL